jgi:hypothetical protein
MAGQERLYPSTLWRVTGSADGAGEFDLWSKCGGYATRYLSA